MLTALVSVCALSACADDAVSPEAATPTAAALTPSAAVVAGVNMIVSKGDPTKCVSVRGGKAVQGAVAELANCTGSPTQQFSQQSNGEIRVANTNLCLDAFGGASKDGDVVGLWACKGYMNQRWSYDAATSRVVGDKSKCLDANGGVFSAGTSVIIWGCHNDANQKWSFTAPTSSPPPADTATTPTTPPPTTPPPTTPSGPAQAFPGALGFGSSTVAGRGGPVLRVTNLNDSGVGSLRAALTASGPRTVICEISGTIMLSSKISISNPNLTFAGQTCPAPGLTLRRFGISVRTHDVLIQHIRVRVGDEIGGGNNDAMEILGPNGYNVVIDHTSLSWATDENFSTWYNGARDITLMNSIVNENLGSGGILIGDSTKNVSIIRNLTVSNKDRHPYIKGATTSLVANNLWYNYLDYPATYLSDPEVAGPQQAGVQGNHYLPGPNSNQTGKPIRITATNRSGVKLFVANNALGRNASAPSDPWSLVTNSFGSSAVTTSAPVWPSGFTPLDVSQVYNTVVTNVGMCPNWRDAVDQRLIANVQNGTGTMISSQSQVGGWPSLAVNTRALTPPADPKADDDGDGYTNVEEWLHGFYAACGGHN
jgi:hypothetical protein